MMILVMVKLFTYISSVLVKKVALFEKFFFTHPKVSQTDSINAKGAVTRSFLSFY